VNEEGVDQYILNNEKWTSLKAVKNKKVYKIPNGISRWGHPGSLETPLAIIWTSKKLYPEYFSDVNLDETVRGFYEQFFNYTLNDDLTQKILSGNGMRLSKHNKKK